MTVAVFVFSLCGAMALGMPIAFALLVCGAALMLHLGMFDTRILAQNLIVGADSFALMAIPFFILVGELMNAGGISKRIIGFGLSLVGHIRGGLGYVAIMTAFIFAGLSGSAVADTAALAAIMVPMMADAGYDKSRSAALIGAGSIVAPILPPSIPFIIFGSLSGVSIMKLFMAGLFPGLVIAISLAITWWYMARKKNVKVFERKSFKEIIIAFKDAVWALALPILIMVGIKGGVVTPTEAAVAAVFYTLFLCFVVYRALTDKRWKLVFLHRPPYHSKSATSNDRVREAFVPILDKYHADVVFSGHEHVYARTYPLYADSIANQGTVYITTGRSGTKYYNQAEANGWDEVFYNPVDQPNYLTVQIAGDTLAVKAWKQDGELIDEWHVDKSDPVRLGMAAN